MIRRLATTIDRVLAGLEGAVVVVALALLVVLSSYQMVLRNIHQPSPGWIDPLLHQLVLWAGFLGAVLAVRSRSHIHFDLVAHRLSPAWGVRVDFGVRLVSAAICLLLARASWTFVLAERETMTSEIAGIPGWIFPSAIPLSFALMALHFLLPSTPEAGPPAGEGMGGGA